MLTDLTVHRNLCNPIRLCIDHLDCSRTILTHYDCVIVACLFDCQNYRSLTHQSSIRLTADCKAVTSLRAGRSRNPIRTVPYLIRHRCNDIHMDIRLFLKDLVIFCDRSKTRTLKDLSVRPLFA